VLQLALDVREQSTGAEPEQIWTQPPIAQLVLHQRQPIERLPGGANTAGGLESDQLPGALTVVSNSSSHHQPNRQGGIDVFLAG
jgi:hypothetical protein